MARLIILIIALGTANSQQMLDIGCKDGAILTGLRVESKATNIGRVHIEIRPKCFPPGHVNHEDKPWMFDLHQLTPEGWMELPNYNFIAEIDPIKKRPIDGEGEFENYSCFNPEVKVTDFLSYGEFAFLNVTTEPVECPDTRISLIRDDKRIQIDNMIFHIL